MNGILRGGRGLFFALALPVVLVVAWWFGSANSTNFFFPSLSSILETFGRTWFAERMRADVLPSVTRLLIGYAGAVVLGVALGVVLGANRTLRRITEPVLEFFRAIPPPVLIPVLFLFAGIGNTAKVIVIVLGALWPILLNTVEGVRAVDEVLSDTSRCYRVTGWARLRHLVLPAASPQIVAGMRQALSISIILMVISEMFASSNGLGFTIIQFQRSFAIPEMWSGIILLGLLGFVLSLLFQLFERRSLRWYQGLRRSQRGE
ncbi:ABC transporter permease [Planosporangium mesophilum]|uniref:Nitrate ABC transporter permease n=1 Tax=Planosporangium mesophilum TaxID=689768 RepID=A0A8J3TFB1_9ACTN|nr:ABC transporter permease [Planosporangium mesophilum]NJC85402.1 ABC transporter permease [Planosporangium mesophilum]GII24087.1 nitrate ABC transporter permease [Planosporangium mesophilum]